MPITQIPLTSISAKDDALAEMMADRLLTEAGAVISDRGTRRNGGSGCYTERQLTQHRRKEYSNNENAILTAIAEEREMTISDVGKLCRLAHMTDEQTLIWNLYHQGVSGADIARVLLVTRQNIDMRIEVCRKLLMRAMINAPWWGWYAVWLAEIHRG